jgi:hypothetical protein
MNFSKKNHEHNIINVKNVSKKIIDFFAITLILTLTMLLFSSTTYATEPEYYFDDCAASYDKCNTAYPSDFRKFTKCMHIEATCY